jgi:lactoylglutathione lyase
VSRGPCAAVAQLELIALATRDVEGLRDFYLQLGAVAAPSLADPGTGLRSCVLDFCGVRVELFERVRRGDASDGEARSPGILHLGFAVESADAVDQLSAVIAAAGHKVIEPPHRTGDPGRYESVVLDPDGNRIRIAV